VGRADCDSRGCRSRGELAAGRRVATLVAHGAAPDVVFEAVTREVRLLCDADLARTERYEPHGTLTGLAAWSRTGSYLAVGTRFAVQGASIATLVRETSIRRGWTALLAQGPIAEEVRRLGIRSSVGCPILVGGRLWSVVTASVTRERPFPPRTESKSVSSRNRWALRTPIYARPRQLDVGWTRTGTVPDGRRANSVANKTVTEVPTPTGLFTSITPPRSSTRSIGRQAPSRDRDRRR
jgi:hypothetical protein